MSYWITATENSQAIGMNGVGVMEYTIYDSSGRYRGFSHLPPGVSVNKSMDTVICYIQGRL